MGWGQKIQRALKWRVAKNSEASEQIIFSHNPPLLPTPDLQV
jgi:hypothetical protein